MPVDLRQVPSVLLRFAPVLALASLHAATTASAQPVGRYALIGHVGSLCGSGDGSRCEGGTLGGGVSLAVALPKSWDASVRVETGSRTIFEGAIGNAGPAAPRLRQAESRWLSHVVISYGADRSARVRPTIGAGFGVVRAAGETRCLSGCDGISPSQFGLGQGTSWEVDVFVQGGLDMSVWRKVVALVAVRASPLPNASVTFGALAGAGLRWGAPPGERSIGPTPSAIPQGPWR